MDQIDGLRANALPLFVVYAELARFDFLDYLIVVDPVERRITAEQNVENHTNAPKIAFLIVLVLQHLGSDVVWSSELLVHFLIRIEDA